MYNWSLQREGEVFEKKIARKSLNLGLTKQNYKFTYDHICILIHICDVIQACHAEYSDPGAGGGKNNEVRALHILIL